MWRPPSQAGRKVTTAGRDAEAHAASRAVRGACGAATSKSARKSRRSSTAVAPWEAASCFGVGVGGGKQVNRRHFLLVTPLPPSPAHAHTLSRTSISANAASSVAAVTDVHRSVGARPSGGGAPSVAASDDAAATLSPAAPATMRVGGLMGAAKARGGREGRQRSGPAAMARAGAVARIVVGGGAGKRWVCNPTPSCWCVCVWREGGAAPTQNAESQNTCAATPHNRPPFSRGGDKKTREALHTQAPPCLAPRTHTPTLFQCSAR